MTTCRPYSIAVSQERTWLHDMHKAILERTNGEVDVDVGGLYQSLQTARDEGAVASRWCDEDVEYAVIPRYELTQRGVELAEQWLDALRARRQRPR